MRSPADRVRGLASIMVPFGAAASPDLTILPVFLAATAAGAFTAAGALIVFSAVTIGTIVGLTLLACFGGYQVRRQWLERWGNVVTACSPCNLFKGNRLLYESAMHLQRAPMEPTTQQLQENGRAFPPGYLHESWRDFLYWDSELDQN